MHVFRLTILKSVGLLTTLHMFYVWRIVTKLKQYKKYISNDIIFLPGLALSFAFLIRDFAFDLISKFLISKRDRTNSCRKFHQTRSLLTKKCSNFMQVVFKFRKQYSMDQHLHVFLSMSNIKIPFYFE